MLHTEVPDIDSHQLERRVRQELSAEPAGPANSAAGQAARTAEPGVSRSVPPPPVPAPSAPASQKSISAIVGAVRAYFGRHGHLQTNVSAIWTWAEDMARRVHDLEKLARRVRELEHEVASHAQHLKDMAPALARLQGDVRFEHRRLARLMNTEPASERPSVHLAGAPDVLHRFSLDFAERFRGPREDTKRRLRVHLDRLKDQPALTAAHPVLDIECGLGEWLELLGEAGIKAYGLDTNPYAVELCERRGLEVRQTNALMHLANLPDNSLGGISAFHVIEHLPLDNILLLIDEARRTLVPGGLLLLETPNPENLRVEALTFHRDPTHLRPIPPLLGSYLVESRGFSDVEILRLNPYPEEFLIREDTEVARRLNAMVYGPQDVAVIARKA